VLPYRRIPSDEDELEFGACIYYYNMIDCYPHIERFLARCFAEGNWERAKRLASAQYQGIKQEYSTIPENLSSFPDPLVT